MMTYKIDACIFRETTFGAENISPWRTEHQPLIILS